MGDWPIGLSTGCFYQTSILECLAPIREAGFGRIEVCSFPAHLNYHHPDAVRQAAQRIGELGLEAYSFHAPFAEHIDITSLDHNRRQCALDEILRAGEAAATIGTQYFVLHPGPERGGFPEHERFARMENAVATLDRATDRLRESGVQLVLENMLPHLFSGHVRDLLWIMGALKSADIGICLDTGHAHLSGDLRTVVHKLSGHLWMVHASDNHGQFDDHLPPGDGRIDWSSLIKQLSQSRFQGGIILEIAWNQDRDHVLQNAQRGRSFLREKARKLHFAQGSTPS